MSLHVPHLNKTDLDLQRKDDELLITAGDYHRVLTLPDSLLGLEVESAAFDDERLTIVFA